MDGKLAYTVAEAVLASGIGRTSLYEAIKRGRLARLKCGSRTLIPADSLKAFLASLPSEHTSKAGGGNGKAA